MVGSRGLPFRFVWWKKGGEGEVEVEDREGYKGRGEREYEDRVG